MVGFLITLLLVLPWLVGIYLFEDWLYRGQKSYSTRFVRLVERAWRSRRRGQGGDSPRSG